MADLEERILKSNVPGRYTGWDEDGGGDGGFGFGDGDGDGDDGDDDDDDDGPFRPWWSSWLPTSESECTMNTAIIYYLLARVVCIDSG